MRQQRVNRKDGYFGDPGNRHAQRPDVCNALCIDARRIIKQGTGMVQRIRMLQQHGDRNNP